MKVGSRDPMVTDSGRSGSSCPAAVLWIVVPTAAAWLRFSTLGARVLTPNEAGAAWSAWSGVYGSSAATAGVEIRPASPLLDNLLWLTFQCAEPSDALARAGPALAGSLLVLLPWFLRSWLGCWGSLAAAVLLATDPWQIAFSRAADGTIFSAFLGLSILAFAESTGSGHKNTASRDLAAVLWAAFAASGIEFWSLAPPVAIFLICSDGRAQRLRRCWNGCVRHDVLWRSAGIFAFSFFLLASLFGWRWENLARVGSSLTDWLQGWGAGTAAYDWDWVFTRWLREQPLTLAAGAAGLVMLWLGDGEQGRMRSRVRAGALGIWLVWGLLITVPAGRGPSGLLAAGLPLELAAAFALGRFVERAALKWDPPAWLANTGTAFGLAAALFLWSRGLHRAAVFPGLQIGIEHAFAAAAALALLFSPRLRLRPEGALLMAAWLFAVELNGGVSLLRRLRAEPVFFNPIGHPDLRRMQHDARLWDSPQPAAGRDIRIRWDSARHLEAQAAWHLREIAASDTVRAYQESGGKPIWVAGRTWGDDSPVEFSPPIRYRAGVRRTPSRGRPNQESAEGSSDLSQFQSEVVSIWLSTK